MSKINAVRLINLNYNNNAIRISDEIFRMNGKSTLLSLRNGGGKSVLVQMMMAPFVHKRYRDAKDRPFESYFTTPKPTFLMVEWELDQGAGFVLTGMMVRKSQDISGENTENLDIINFISEYKEESLYDLVHLCVVEKKKKEIILKNFGTCRQLFETWKKDPAIPFYCYDMTSQSQSKQYFDRLKQYQIDYREWESIIKKINLKESGLSDMFSDSKDEKGLTEKWFLDAVESKLNKESNRMSGFQTLIGKYAAQYKENHAKMEIRDTIKAFEEQAEKIEGQIGRYQTQNRNCREKENQIVAFKEELSLLYEKIQLEIGKLEEESVQIQEEIAFLQYEKLSSEIYDLKEKEQDTGREQNLIMMEQEGLERQWERIQRALHILKAARQNVQMRARKQEWERQKQKLEILKQEQVDLEPERYRLGYTLKKYYQEKLQEQKIIEEQNQSAQEKAKEQMAICQEQERNLEKLIGKLHQNIGKLRGILQTFDDKEQFFNHRYGEHFTRNIIGEYEAGLLGIYQKNYQEQLQETDRQRIENKRKLESQNEKQKEIERSIEEGIFALSALKNEQNRVEKIYSGYEEQIVQRRKILHYLELEENDLFDREKILQVCDRKLKVIEEEKRKAEQEEDALQKKYRKLTQGKILELTPEMEEMLTNLEIHYVYGMEWLKRNGRTWKQNCSLIKKHPFLPYALLLSRQDLKKLEGNPQGVYTSFPVPVIVREDLETGEISGSTSLHTYPGVSFYVFFNEQLLDEKALSDMVAEINLQIAKKQKIIAVKAEEYSDYFSRKEMLKNQNVTKENYESLERTIKKTIEQTKEQERYLGQQKELLAAKKEEIDTLQRAIAKEKAKTEYYRHREEDFAVFCKNYEVYSEEKKQLDRESKELQQTQERRNLNGEILTSQQEHLQTFLQESTRLQLEEKKLWDAYQIYENYDETETAQGEILTLTARYQAITGQISEKQQELEALVVTARGSYEEEAEELKHLEKKFQLRAKDYEHKIYDRKEETHQECLEKECQKKLQLKKQQWHEKDRLLAIYRHDLEKLQKDLQKKCQKDYPLPKEEILHIDLEARTNQLEYQKSELEKKKGKLHNQKTSYEQNLVSLAEFEETTLGEKVVWEEDFEKMTAKQLGDFQGILKRNYRQSLKQLGEAREDLAFLLNQITRMPMFQDEYFKKPLETLLALIQDPDIVGRQLSTIMQSYENQMYKLDVDLSMVEREKENVAELLEDYVREVHENLGKIDRNSTITVRNRAIKMLKIELPGWEENKNIYSMRIHDFIDEITQKGVELFEKNENAPEYFGTQITTKKVYDAVVGISNVQIRLYKIEEQREYPITWAEVAKNSGGEGFLSAFVILTSLLYYMRKDDSDIFADKNEGKVLVMDNPFAQTNAAHLLKPLMEMAKKTNTQLICLSGLGGESIYHRFDNIYVLNLIAGGLRSGMQYLKTEHRKGGEEEHIVASQVEVYEQGEFLF